MKFTTLLFATALTVMAAMPAHAQDATIDDAVVAPADSANIPICPLGPDDVLIADQACHYLWGKTNADNRQNCIYARNADALEEACNQKRLTWLRNHLNENP